MNENQRPGSKEPSPIPGDPFPWEPERRPAESGVSQAPPGATPTPASSADPASFDLGGGD